ncbi:MAG: hypothetical protein B7Y96_04630 [Comamonadaceae bacterium 32-67-11]|nr:MAG: hypothetical protein B7Y96_04630 [Comamonadaceae bacterium 32-67-11]
MPTLTLPAPTDTPTPTPTRPSLPTPTPTDVPRPKGTETPRLTVAQPVSASASASNAKPRSAAGQRNPSMAMVLCTSKNGNEAILTAVAPWCRDAIAVQHLSPAPQSPAAAPAPARSARPHPSREIRRWLWGA